MRETSKLPTASLRALSRRPSFHCRSQGAPKSRCQIRRRQNSTECHTIRQNTTRCNRNSCTRARARGNSVPLDSANSFTRMRQEDRMPTNAPSMKTVCVSHEAR